jgi:hypothetical protein
MRPALSLLCVVPGRKRRAVLALCDPCTARYYPVLGLRAALLWLALRP